MSEPRLRVEAPLGVVVTVLDGALRPVAGGPGGVDARLPRGLYRVRWLTGHDLTERVVEHGAPGTTVPAPPGESSTRRRNVVTPPSRPPPAQASSR